MTEIRLAGSRRSADVRVVTDEVGVVEHLGVMARDNHQFAKFNKIGFDREERPGTRARRTLLLLQRAMSQFGAVLA